MSGRQPTTEMARPRLYATEEERLAAKRASWQKYNLAHASERAAHNKLYCKREDVKEKRRELRKLKKSEKPEAEALENSSEKNAGDALDWYDS